MRLPFRLVLSVVLGSLVAAAPAAAQIDARMLRQPDVSATQIAFVYAGDIWVVPKQGGVAVRLSSPRGEESFPRFSPDGKTLAYSANYDGNTDVYTVPAQGGDPTRLTWHPMADRVLDWHPDGTPGAVRRRRARAAVSATTSSIWSPATGGPAEKLPVPYGEFARLLAGRQAARLPAAVAGLPHVEALSRRLGRRTCGRSTSRPRTAANVTSQRRQRREPDVARRHALLPLRSRRQPARQHLGPRQGRRPCAR